MASRPQDTTHETIRRRPAARLYLVTPPIADAAAGAEMLGPALAAADIAAVLLRLAAADERTLINRIKALAPLVQDRGAALLLDGHPDLVARAGADGAHLAGSDALKAAIGTLKPERIAGAGGLASRHDAMQAAEAGADYVMFGEPDPAGKRPSFEAIHERVAWWTEVFEIPCVAYAASLAEVHELGAAEFVAVGDFVFSDLRGPAAAVADGAARLTAESLA
jgi:thiamine-phosphate pyrophosphorylase